MKKGLTKIQIISIVLLWVALCVMLLIFPGTTTWLEKILIAVCSGIIILVGINSNQNRFDRRRKR